MSSPGTTDAPLVPKPPALYATFPRRLNAISVDTIILVLYSIIVFAALPSGLDHTVLRLSLGLLWWGTFILYDPIMVSRFGGTFGHQFLNLRVVDDETGRNLSLPKAIGRFLIKGVLGVASFLTMSFTPRHQAIHDMITTSSVQVRDPAKAALHHYVSVEVDQAPPGAT